MARPIKDSPELSKTMHELIEREGYLRVILAYIVECEFNQSEMDLASNILQALKQSGKYPDAVHTSPEISERVTSEVDK